MEFTININTDGGAFAYTGTFGLVIEIIATNNRKLYRPEVYKTAYWSEVYALLAGLVSFCWIVGPHKH
jgi:hypothetical protein